jgi:hypothetical protein
VGARAARGARRRRSGSWIGRDSGQVSDVSQVLVLRLENVYMGVWPDCRGSSDGRLCQVSRE